LKHLNYEKAKARYFEEMAKKAEEKQEKINIVLVNNLKWKNHFFNKTK